ncbi:MAG: hypothetical protein RIK87_22220 [Fuerstiella sp.]
MQALEDRTLLTTTLAIELRLLQDVAGAPGSEITTDRVDVGQSFFVEIMAGDIRTDAAGIIGLSIDVTWTAAAFQEIDHPFNPGLVITQHLPLNPNGSLDQAAGKIDDLGGGSLPAAGIGSAVGVNVLERFALLHFRAETVVTAAPFTVTVQQDAALGGVSFADEETQFITDIEAQTVTVIDDSAGIPPGDVDGDGDCDANDSFLIQLVKLSGNDSQIEQSKGGSFLTATDIRSRVDQIGTVGDVDGDSDFDANDAFLIHLIKLSGTDAQVESSKGSSLLTPAEIRGNVASLDVPPPTIAPSRASSTAGLTARFSAVSSDVFDVSDPDVPVSSSAGRPDRQNLTDLDVQFSSLPYDAEESSTDSVADESAAAESVPGQFRSWIDAIQ